MRFCPHRCLIHTHRDLGQVTRNLDNLTSHIPGKSCPDSLILGIVLFAWIPLLGGCRTESNAPPPPSVARGRIVYQTQCIACHNPDPRKRGSLGPEVFGSSKELLEARIMRAEYPPGYKPKRNSHTMVALPHLKNDLESIHLFLDADLAPNR
jgi:hypothetical protein